MRNKLHLSLLGRSWRHLVEKTCSDAKTSHNISQNLNLRVEYILFRRLVAFLLAPPSGQKNTFFILWMRLQLAIIQKSVQNPKTLIIVVKDKEKQQNLTFKTLKHWDTSAWETKFTDYQVRRKRQSRQNQDINSGSPSSLLAIKFDDINVWVLRPSSGDLDWTFGIKNGDCTSWMKREEIAKRKDTGR